MLFFEKTKGAISIFLVIILVPMMTMSSAFVDAGKVKLGRAMAESAGDLTLNTALTNYDTDLKELYGLMATAQDTSDLFLKLEDYYTTCLTSCGVSEEDSIYYVDQIMSSLGAVSETNDVADIMNMQVVDFAVKKLDGANLANASIMKKQIVDFMKYRAPINTGISFLSSLKSFSTLNKQTKLVEKKQAYYEEQQTVMQDLKDAWSYIAAYNQTKVASVNGYIETISKNMKIFSDGGKIDNDTYSGFYQPKDSNRPVGLSYLVIWDLYDTSSFLGYNYKVTYGDFTYESPGNSTDETFDYPKLYHNGLVDAFDYYCQKYADGSYDLPTTEDFKEQLSHFYSTLSDVNQLRNAISNKIDIGANEHALRFYVNAMRGSEGVDDYSNKIISLYTSYQKLKAMEIWVGEYDYLEDSESEDGEEVEKTTSADVLNEIIELDKKSHQSDKKNIRSWCDSAGVDFDSAMTSFKMISDKFNAYADDAQTIYDNSYNDALGELSLISSQATEYKNQLESAKTNLTNAIEKLESAKTKLNGTVATAKGEWDKIATDDAIQDTSLAKQDKAEIDQLDKYLNSDNIDKLIKRLTNVLNKVSDALTELEKYQYGGTYFGDISTVEGMCDIYGNKDRTEFLKLSAEKGSLNSHTGNWIVKNCSRGNVEYEWVGTPSTQPNLNLYKTSLYSYLYSHFANVTPASSTEPNVKEENTENGKDFYESIKNTSKEQANGKTSSLSSESSEDEADEDGDEGDSRATEISKMSNLPSKSPDIKNNKETPSGKVDTNVDSGAASASGALDGLFGDGFQNAIAGFGEDLRDKLYISDYIMGMFSYDTIEKEYIQEQKKKKNNIEAVSPGDLQTLTKCDISAQNNYAYGDEIEYIIYGGSYAGNSAKAYASIYGIRFGFNVVYAFATSEIRDSALAIATPISAATLGVIPVPLIQAAIIIGIACCESGIDLDALSQGHKVPLYKTAETWRCSITGLTQLAKNKALEEGKKLFKDVSEAVIDESVNKLNELLDMTNDELDGLLEKANKETEEALLSYEQAITGVFDDVITENAEVAIQQLTTYINTAVENTMCLDAGETYEKKKVEMIEWVKQELTTWGSQFTGDDLVSIVKREAVKVIVSNSDMCINELFNLVEQSILSSNADQDINNILNGSTAEDGLDRLGGVVMEQIKAIRNEISEGLDSATGKIQEYKNEVFEDISKSASKGAEDLKQTINGHIDGMFGSGESSIGNQNGNATGAAAFFSFGYSDYLRLFLLIGTFANEEKILLRTADVIQVNMAKCISSDESYLLSNSAAYVAIDADIQVKPTLLALPIFAKVEKNPMSNSKWYTIEYSGIAGY